MTNSNRGRVLLTLSSLLVLFIFAAPLYAQQTSGVIRDAQTDALLTGVRITSGTNTTFSDAQGHFRLDLAPEAGAVHFSRLGYQALTLALADLIGDVRLTAEPVMLGAITVESQGRSRLATGTSLTMTEVDRGSIQSSGATTIAEALEGAAGVSISRPGAWGAQAVVRGLSGERVAVMVDGMRLNRACYFGMDDGLATIDPSTVERVEILSGPGSTLYGSGSIGGVINVMTRQPTPGADGLSGELRAAASSAIPGGSLGASLALQHGRFDLAVAGEGVRYGTTLLLLVGSTALPFAMAPPMSGWDSDPHLRITSHYRPRFMRAVISAGPRWPDMVPAAITTGTMSMAMMLVTTKVGMAIMAIMSTRCRFLWRAGVPSPPTTAGRWGAAFSMRSVRAPICRISITRCG